MRTHERSSEREKIEIDDGWHNGMTRVVFSINYTHTRVLETMARVVDGASYLLSSAIPLLSRIDFVDGIIPEPGSTA